MGVELTWAAVLAVLGMAFFAAFVQSAIGFGYSLIFVPVVALVTGASDAVAVALLGGTVVATMLYVEHHPRVPLRSVAPLVIAAVVGAPAGVALLVLGDDDVLHLVVGVAVLASALVNLAQRATHPIARPDRLPGQLVAGLLSGAMRGAVAMPGPPVILYQHWIGGGAGAIRSRMFAFFFWMSLPTLAIAAGGGAFSRVVMAYGALAIPAILAGVLGGRLIRPVLSERSFSLLSMLLLAVTSAAAVAGAVRALAG